MNFTTQEMTDLLNGLLCVESEFDHLRRRTPEQVDADTYDYWHHRHDKLVRRLKQTLNRRATKKGT